MSSLFLALWQNYCLRGLRTSSNNVTSCIMSQTTLQLSNFYAKLNCVTRYIAFGLGRINGLVENRFRQTPVVLLYIKYQTDAYATTLGDIVRSRPDEPVERKDGQIQRSQTFNHFKLNSHHFPVLSFAVHLESNRFAISPFCLRSATAHERRFIVDVTGLTFYV